MPFGFLSYGGPKMVFQAGEQWKAMSLNIVLEQGHVVDIRNLQNMYI